MINFYNSEVERYQAACDGLSKNDFPDVGKFIDKDPTKISWSRGIKNNLSHFIKRQYSPSCLTIALYRPFTKQWMYFNRQFNEMVNQMPNIFPSSEYKNCMIYVTGVGAGKGFSSLIVDHVPNLHTLDTGQGFPLKLYEESITSTGDDLFSSQNTQEGYTVKDGITDTGLAHFHAAYMGEVISKEDIFYYIYGLLHSEDYRARYANNLSKQLPCIPCVKTATDFWVFSNAGRELAELHINYETAPVYPVTIGCNKKHLKDEDYRVVQMKFAKKDEKSTVIYNHNITIADIPLEAYEYMVSGKSALEWVMERQAVTTHKDSGIINDANRWATETMGNAKYPLELFQRVITVSLVTMKIVNSLPTLTVTENVAS